MTQPVYDLAIIGGGIAGAGIARDAALRGLKVILFEKNTFGSGTSSKSSKLIHGGIRYLDLAWVAFKKGDFSESWKNFSFVFSSLKETHALARIAPDLVRPIPLLAPIYKKEGRGPLAIYAGTLLYSFLAALSGSRNFPRLLLSAKAVQREIPDLQTEDLAGGVLFWDHTTDDRSLVRETMRSAERHGAVALEHACVTGYSRDEAKKTYEIKIQTEREQKNYIARKLINATGAWIDRVRALGGAAGENWVVPVSGCHITLKKFIPQSLVLQASDDRVFFVINIGDKARVGTTERLENNPDHVEATDQEIEYLLRALDRYFPSKKFTRKDILSTDAGIRPLAKPGDSVSLNSISREHEIRTDSLGVLHILGVKLTDHRRAAEQIVNTLVPYYPHIQKKSTTSSTSLKS